MQSDISVAFVGAIIPDEPSFRTKAFSASGQMYQENLLRGLESAGMCDIEVLSYQVLPSFPTSKRIWAKGGNFESKGLKLQLVPFINITPLKQFLIGVQMWVRLVGWALRRIGKPRVITIYNLTVPPGIFIWAAARMTGSRCVVLLCDVNVPGQRIPSTPATRLDFRMQRWLAPRFDGRVAVSDAGMRELCPGKSYIRVEGGITQEALEMLQNLPRKSSSCNSHFILAFAGRLDETNGISVMLEAMKHLPSNFRLLLAGSGPLEDLVRQAADVDDRISFEGMIPFEHVLELYGKSDLLLNVRMTQSLQTQYFFPGKFMEYAASGTPVLSTRTGHIPEEFGNFTYLLNDESACGLAAEVLRIAQIDEADRRRIACVAREYMEKNKMWPRQARRVAEYLCEIVLGQRAAARQAGEQ
jgi:glycosyltransferase involved in cell wall biosynthesis